MHAVLCQAVRITFLDSDKMFKMTGCTAELVGVAAGSAALPSQAGLL